MHLSEWPVSGPVSFLASISPRDFEQSAVPLLQSGLGPLLYVAPPTRNPETLGPEGIDSHRLAASVSYSRKFFGC